MKQVITSSTISRLSTLGASSTVYVEEVKVEEGNTYMDKYCENLLAVEQELRDHIADLRGKIKKMGDTPMRVWFKGVLNYGAFLRVYNEFQRSMIELKYCQKHLTELRARIKSYRTQTGEMNAEREVNK